MDDDEVYDRVHIVDEDGVEPICGHASAGDGMWWFNDDRVTCAVCRARYQPGAAVDPRIGL